MTENAFDTWFEKYQPIKNTFRSAEASFDGTLFETFGKELEHVRLADPSKVWTLIDAEGSTIIESGFHYVNRIGYFITERAVRVEDRPVVIEVDTLEELRSAEDNFIARTQGFEDSDQMARSHRGPKNPNDFCGTCGGECEFDSDGAPRTEKKPTDSDIQNQPEPSNEMELTVHKVEVPWGFYLSVLFTLLSLLGWLYLGNGRDILYRIFYLQF